MSVFDESVITWGQAGIPGTGVSEAEKLDIISRLEAREALVIPDTITDLTDVDLTGIATGDLLQWDGSALVPYTPAAITQTFTIPFVLDGDGSAIAAATYYASGIHVPTACTIIGWRVRNSGNHDIDTTIQHGPVASGTWTSISGTENPRTTGTYTNVDMALTTWTVVNLAAGDALRVVVNSGTAVASTISIYLTRTL